MLTDQGLKAQISRLKLFPRYEESKAELLKTLWTHALSDEHAIRIVDRLIAGSAPSSGGVTMCPTPFQLTEIASQVPESGAPPPAPARNCQLCSGSGWAMERRIVNGIPYDFARRCTCHRPPDARETA